MTKKRKPCLFLTDFNIKNKLIFETSMFHQEPIDELFYFTKYLKDLSAKSTCHISPH